MRGAPAPDAPIVHQCPVCQQRVALDADRPCGACRGRERYQISADLLALLRAIDEGVKA